MTANNITDGKVQALPIKPLKTHAGEGVLLPVLTIC
mgnify:CR=1 FL=1